jgi:hypothetical protein
VNKLCPGCGTAYNLSPADAGREFSCFKCNASLIVRKDGIQLVETRAAMPIVEAAPLEIESSPAKGRSTALQRGAVLSRWFHQVADTPTWLFGFGTFLVILCLFFPLIDQAKVNRAKGAIEAGQLREERLDREIKDKKDVSPSEEEVRKRAKENWAKEKDRLQEESATQGIAAKQNDYWYLWGMMLGFMILAVAALGYLNLTQPVIRRIIGAIVILAEVLLIFLKFIVRV